MHGSAGVQACGRAGVCSRFSPSVSFVRSFALFRSTSHSLQSFVRLIKLKLADLNTTKQFG